ncbi:MAG TPA: hypothetical protein VFD73_13675, partial [Gemmatimonadales bacterium]|nr:hypothetical protein [Gemmatimonadales bacterium]
PGDSSRLRSLALDLAWIRYRTVIVRLALQETHDGPLATPFGVFPGREAVNAPRAGSWEVEDGKIRTSTATRRAPSSSPSSVPWPTSKPRSCQVGGAQDNDRA